jgi:hypothetical protein
VRTLIAGLRTAKGAPLALIPLSAAGLACAVLVAAGAFPATGASVPAGAAFPLDLFFDLKQGVAFAPGWIWFIGAMLIAVAARGALLAATLWLAEGAPGPFVTAWVAGMRLTALAAVVLFPGAALFFVGVATRYAPFVWMAGAAAGLGAAWLARRAVKIDVGGGVPKGRGVPEIPGFLGYVMFVTVTALTMTVLARVGTWAASAVPLFVGPAHALYLLGWRRHLSKATYPGGGAFATFTLVAAVVFMLGSTVYDRYLRDTPPVARADAPGTLLGLGGADSTSTSGALTRIDPRDVGFGRNRTELLSYRGDGTEYSKADTHADLGLVAAAVADQIDDAEPPRVLLGHSQAALILDRVLRSDLAEPEAAVLLAPSPPIPPPVEIPQPSLDGPGRVGGDLARAFSWLLDTVGLEPLDIDGPASPTNLEAVIVEESGTPRLSVWAMGDSVWLARDWRRPGETNVVALTDHVGVTNDGRALELAREFFNGETIEPDDSSWRGAVAGFYRYLFEPWRPR